MFTDRAFAGNPLAVVTDATGLQPAQMQAIAAEFNYSESTFVLPPDDPAHTARVRIFTRQNEIPFGATRTSAPPSPSPRSRSGRGSRWDRRSSSRKAPASCRSTWLRDADARVIGATLTAPQPLSLGQRIPAAGVAACVGLDASAVLTARHEPVDAGRLTATGTPPGDRAPSGPARRC